MTRERAPALPPLRERLLAGLQSLSLRLDGEAVTQLLAYVEELVKWNAAYNLTAVRDPGEMVTRHLLDSLALLPVLDEVLAGKTDVRILDVGAGAGLPCIPLAIARPQWGITGLDSNGKKARFMRHAGRLLGLARFDVIEGRVEDIAEGAPYGLITSRAFASLTEFFMHTEHRLAPGGLWVAMKGKLLPEELREVPAQKVRILEQRRLAVPGLAEERHAILAAPIPVATTA